LQSADSGRRTSTVSSTDRLEKSNEITAIPDLLDLLTLKGAVVTIDATVSACRLR